MPLTAELITVRVLNGYLCTYDLNGPVRNVFDACRSITRTSGRGLGPGNREFFGPFEMASSRHLGPKNPINHRCIGGFIQDPTSDFNGL